MIITKNNQINHSAIANIRLASQQLLMTELKTPASIVSWMGAMQAQDFTMAKWAVGIRTPGCSEKSVESAFDRGEILRTHVMRPTWHFIAPEDIRWMLQLTAPRIKSSILARDRSLEISEELYIVTNRIIQQALEGNQSLTREALSKLFEEHKIVVDPSRVNHFMMRAELDGIVCSGPLQGRKHTYALLEERVPSVKPLNKDEALAKFAKIYFTSHSPATLQDFVWWSGLSVTEARHALEMVKSDFVSETIDSQTYWIAQQFSGLPISEESTLLLPAFDEYIISYRDRKAALSAENHSKAISSNGIFRPTIVRNGQVVGLWKKATTKGKIIASDFFEKPDTFMLDLIEKATGRLKEFKI